MKISIIGISQITDYILDNIVNHSDEINVYSKERNFDFENKNITKNNVSIFTDENIEDNMKKIFEDSDVLFFLSDSDPFNVFSYEKFLAYNPTKKSIFKVSDRDIYETYKNKKYPVISSFDLNDDDYLYLIRE
ncbi:MAG: hypothetical protein VX552_04425 [Chloroflexota bacterium]|nr:hypothetical protein [Chloroflexota bacterium]